MTEARIMYAELLGESVAETIISNPSFGFGQEMDNCAKALQSMLLLAIIKNVAENKSFDPEIYLDSFIADTRELFLDYSGRIKQLQEMP